MDFSTRKDHLPVRTVLRLELFLFGKGKVVESMHNAQQTDENMRISTEGLKMTTKSLHMLDIYIDPFAVCKPAFSLPDGVLIGALFKKNKNSTSGRAL